MCRDQLELCNTAETKVITQPRTCFKQQDREIPRPQPKQCTTSSVDILHSVELWNYWKLPCKAEMYYIFKYAFSQSVY